MAKSSLTDTQLVILSAAAQREDLRIDLPERLRGGAAKAVFSTLLAKSLIETLPDLEDGQGIVDPESSGQTGYRISREGLAAIGIESDAERDLRTPDAGVDDGQAIVAAHSDNDQPPAVTAGGAGRSTSPRAGTKLAEVIALLEREDGASIDELTAATGWLAHTTRAALTGLRKRGLVVERAKREEGTTIYRIAPASAGEAA